MWETSFLVQNRFHPLRKVRTLRRLSQCRWRNRFHSRTECHPVFRFLSRDDHENPTVTRNVPGGNHPESSTSTSNINPLRPHLYYWSQKFDSGDGRRTDRKGYGGVSRRKDCDGRHTTEGCGRTPEGVCPISSRGGRGHVDEDVILVDECQKREVDVEEHSKHVEEEVLESREEHLRIPLGRPYGRFS